VSSIPQSCRAPPPAVGTTTTLQRRGAVTTRTTPTYCSSRPPRWRHRRSTTARRWVLIGGDAQLPHLPPLVVVVVAITLGDLAFLMLRLTRGTPLLRHGLVLVEDRLLRERRLGGGAFQLPQQGRTKVKPEKFFPRQRANETCQEYGQLTNFCHRIGEHRKNLRRRPRVGRPPDRLRHAC
jgi:hypothetical protein